mmetsp:Transcript_68968/g.194505  ORF Transcript_68968/g.194505 Transcript_68968/m.194505 type:complete len:248 (+) Transcript_68968:1568-2311(+)
MTWSAKNSSTTLRGEEYEGSYTGAGVLGPIFSSGSARRSISSLMARSQMSCRCADRGNSDTDSFSERSPFRMRLRPSPYCCQVLKRKTLRLNMSGEDTFARRTWVVRTGCSWPSAFFQSSMADSSDLISSHSFWTVLVLPDPQSLVSRPWSRSHFASALDVGTDAKAHVLTYWAFFSTPGISANSWGASWFFPLSDLPRLIAPLCSPAVMEGLHHFGWARCGRRRSCKPRRCSRLSEPLRPCEGSPV